MRVVFFGTPEFAVPALKALIASPHEVVAIVTQPDRPKGRSNSPSAPPIKEAARGWKIPVLQPHKPNDAQFLSTLKALSPQVGVVVAYGQLLPRDLLTLFPQGVYNLHASLLPKYRGAAPIQWALINGESTTGVTVFQLDDKLDHGPILLQESCSIDPQADAVALGEKLSLLGADILLTALDQLESKKAKLTPQEERLASYAPLLTKEDGAIDWSLSAQFLVHRVRGLQPWPGAYTFWKGKRLLVLRACAKEQDRASQVPPGTVVRVDPQEGFWVQTGEGLLRIDRLQLEGSKAQETTAFLRGHLIVPGTVFSRLV